MGAGQGFLPQGGGRGEQGGWLWGSGGTSAAGGFELMGGKSQLRLVLSV